MKSQNSNISRRAFIGTTVAAIAAHVVMPKIALAATPKPNSNFDGVQIGAITYSFRYMPGSAEDILDNADVRRVYLGEHFSI